MSETRLDHAAMAARVRQAYAALGQRPPAQIFNDAGDDYTDEVFEFVRAHRISFDWLVAGESGRQGRPLPFLQADQITRES